MRKKTLILNVLIIILLSSCSKDLFKDNRKTWKRESPVFLRKVRDFHQGPDGYYYVIGDIQDEDGGRIYCAEEGNRKNCKKRWKVELDKVATARSLEFTSDGNIIATGMREDGSQDIGPAVLLKLDMQGNILWTKDFMYDVRTKIFDIIETADQGFLMCGYVTGATEWGYTYSWGLLIKTDKDGNELWTKRYGNPEEPGDYNEFYDIEKFGSNYIIVGQRKRHDNDNYAGYFMKISPSGGIISERFDDAVSYFNEVTISSDDKAVMIGGVYSGGTVIKKVNPDDYQKIWQTNIDNPCTHVGLSDIVETSDKGFIATNYYIMILKLDKDGNVQKKIGQHKAINGMITPTKDGYYMIAGSGSFMKVDKDLNYEEKY